MTRLKQRIKGDKNCVHCSGSGLVDGPQEIGFNVARMERVLRETRVPCKCAEIDEPDWDQIRKAKKEA